MKKFFILVISLVTGLAVYSQKHTAELLNIPGAIFTYTIEGKGPVASD